MLTNPTFDEFVKIACAIAVIGALAVTIPGAQKLRDFNQKRGVSDPLVNSLAWIEERVVYLVRRIRKR